MVQFFTFSPEALQALGKWWSWERRLETSVSLLPLMSSLVITLWGGENLGSPGARGTFFLQIAFKSYS